VRRASLRCVVPTFLRIPLLIPQLDDKATSDNAEPGLVSTTAARPLPRVLTVTSTQRTVSAPENFSSARTDISEPVTDVTVMLDTPGRAMRARPRTASARVGSVSQVLSSATLGEPFVDVRSSAYQDANGSPLLVRPASTFALNASPGMSEGLSVQYEDIPGSSASGASPNKTVKKWRLHFAKPPSAAEAMAIKPVTTSVLAEKLELDEETVSFFCAFHYYYYYAGVLILPLNRGVPSTSGFIFVFYLEKMYRRSGLQSVSPSSRFFQVIRSRRIWTCLPVRSHLARITGRDVHRGVERGHERSDHQDLHHRSQGKTRRAAHLYICSKEGAYLLRVG
jgi:hypothetical protein